MINRKMQTLNGGILVKALARNIFGYQNDVGKRHERAVATCILLALLSIEALPHILRYAPAIESLGHIPRRCDMTPSLGTACNNIKPRAFVVWMTKTCIQINYPYAIVTGNLHGMAAIGTALASPAILWALAPFAALGAILPGHPSMFYTPWAAVTCWENQPCPAMGKETLRLCLGNDDDSRGRIGLSVRDAHDGLCLRWSLVAAAFVNVSTGFCIPSFIVRIFPEGWCVGSLGGATCCCSPHAKESKDLD